VTTDTPIDRPVPYLVAAAVASKWQREALQAVADLGLPDCWIAAGFVRNAVWDLLHGYRSPTPLADIDVLFFDEHNDRNEAEFEAFLTAALPQHTWQVRNQARMHRVNGFAPFRSSGQAMWHWVETPTAVGLAMDRLGRLQIKAPLGVGDLMGLRLQPGPMFRTDRRGIYRERVRAKRWAERWPRLRVLGT